MSIRTHKLTFEARFEGEPLDQEDLQQVANQIAHVILSLIEHRDVGGEFCDLGLKQDIDITVGE